MQGRTTIFWEDESGQQRWLMFDIVESIAHNQAAEITESPVEDGSPVADHAFNAADALTIEGVVSNTPLPQNPGVGEGGGEVNGALPAVTNGPLMAPTDIEFNLPQPPPRAPIFTPGGLTEALVDGVDGLLGRTRQTMAAGAWVHVDAGAGPGPVKPEDIRGNYLDRVREAFDIIRQMKRTFRRCRVETSLHTYSNMMLRVVNVPEEFNDGDSKTFRLEFKEIQTASRRTVEAPEPAEIRGTPPANSNKQTKPPKAEGEKVEKAESRSALVQLFDATLGR